MKWFRWCVVALVVVVTLAIAAHAAWQFVEFPLTLPDGSERVVSHEEYPHWDALYYVQGYCWTWDGAGHWGTEEMPRFPEMWRFYAAHIRYWRNSDSSDAGSYELEWLSNILPTDQGYPVVVATAHFPTIGGNITPPAKVVAALLANETWVETGLWPSWCAELFIASGQPVNESEMQAGESPWPFALPAKKRPKK